MLKELEKQMEGVLHADAVSQARTFMGARSGLWMVSLISFFESALPLPIITDPFLVAAILSNRANVARIILYVTITSVLGGLLAYYTFYLFFETVLTWLTPGLSQQFQQLSAGDGSNTFVLTILGAVTPIPYTIVAWVVGVLKGNALVFILASFIGRGARYIIVGYSTYYFGPYAIKYARRYIGFTTILLLILAALFVWYKM